MSRLFLFSSIAFVEPKITPRRIYKYVYIATILETRTKRLIMPAAHRSRQGAISTTTSHMTCAVLQHFPSETPCLWRQNPLLKVKNFATNVVTEMLEEDFFTVPPSSSKQHERKPPEVISGHSHPTWLVMPCICTRSTSLRTLPLGRNLGYAFDAGSMVISDAGVSRAPSTNELVFVSVLVGFFSPLFFIR